MTELTLSHRVRRRALIVVTAALLLASMGLVFGCMPSSGSIHDKQQTLEVARYIATQAAVEVTRAADPALTAQVEAETDTILVSAPIPDAIGQSNRLFVTMLMLAGVVLLPTIFSYLVIRFILSQIMIAAYQARTSEFQRRTMRLNAKIEEIRRHLRP